ncbi:MAG: ATP-binding cassette domain-containing protein [Deltaproteobacteria bacterium]|jgi:iron complex transport system ATP-binding protein|nr:ATP-binding cassette domain-containing protein [Deltaproteobacteria bacterium]
MEDKSDEKTTIGVDGVSLTRGGLTLLNDINWRVGPGEHWTVLGPNGAGKTLLLRIVTGYVWPSRGKVTVLGRLLGTVDLRQIRKRVGWVSQAVADLMPSRNTLLETIASGPLASLGLYVEPEKELLEKAERISEEYGLSDKLKRPFGLLSSGERQRTLLARAAMTEPELLILDEPMSNLDMGGRELFLSHAGKLAALPSAPTIILTTHNTLEIGPFVTHGLILKEGRVLTRGPIEETMTSEKLSRAFDLPLVAEKSASGRYLATLSRG